MRFAGWFVLLLGLWGLATVFDSGAQIALEDFQVNTYTTGHQANPAVAAVPGGGFIVVWESLGGQDGDKSGLFAQRYDEDGLAVGGEFQVNSYTTGEQKEASVAVASGGNFVVVWASSQGDGGGYGITARRFDATGTAQGDDFLVNTTTARSQRAPAIAALGGGGFVVVWQSEGQDGSGLGVFGQRLNTNGTKLGGEFQVNSYTTRDQRAPQVVATTDGGFTVVWTSDPNGGAGQDGSNAGIFGQRFDAAGDKVGGEFAVNGFTTGRQVRPSIVQTPDGGYVVVWESREIEAGAAGTDAVVARKLAADTSAVTDDVQVNTYTTGFQEDAWVAVSAAGEIVIVWEADGSDAGIDTSSKSVVARRYDAALNADGGEIQVNSYTTGEQDDPRVAALSDGSFVIVWESTGQDGDLAGIFGQILGSGSTTTTLSAGSTTTTTSGPPSTGGSTTTASSTTSSSMTTTSSTTTSSVTTTTSTTLIERPLDKCGDTAGTRKITSLDALGVLRASVGTTTCELCKCDVDSSGAITTSDALLVLQVAVGLDATLDCPPCA